MEDLTRKYRNNIPTREAIEAFKVYYSTKDKKIREQLIYRYMPLVEKMALKSEYTVDREDLIQMSYEILIDCIDKYNPYENCHFYVFLHSKVTKTIKRYIENRNQEILSLSNLEIYSNTDFETSVINQIDNEQLVLLVKDLLNKYNNKRYANIFKMVYGIDYECMKKTDVAKKENISQSMVELIIQKVLLYLFLNISENYEYYPSEIIMKFIHNDHNCCTHSVPKSFKDMFDNISLDELDYLYFNEDYDRIIDSHELVKKN